MDRRNFLKVLGAGGVLVATPTVLHSVVFTQEYQGLQAVEAALNSSFFDVHAFLEDIPKMFVQGNTLKYCRQNSYPFKNMRTYGHFTTNFCSVIGDVELPPNTGVHSSSNEYFNMRILSSNKSISRKILDLVINGNNKENKTEFDGLLKLAELGGAEYNKMSWSMSSKGVGGCKKHYRNGFVPDGYEVQGNFDPGDHSKGITLIYPKVEHPYVSVTEISDISYRLKSYVSLALFDQADLRIIKI